MGTIWHNWNFWNAFNECNECDACDECGAYDAWLQQIIKTKKEKSSIVLLWNNYSRWSNEINFAIDCRLQLKSKKLKEKETIIRLNYFDVQRNYANVNNHIIRNVNYKNISAKSQKIKIIPP